MCVVILINNLCDLHVYRREIRTLCWKIFGAGKNTKIWQNLAKFGKICQCRAVFVTGRHDFISMTVNIGGTINLRETPLPEIESVPWQHDGFISVEFFEGYPTPICVTNVSDDNFEDLLSWVDDGSEYLYADLEWRPDRTRDDKHRPCIFQIGSSKGALIIRHPTDLPASVPLLNFLNSHKFYMKGMFCDREKLRLLYGADIHLSRFKDIEVTMLRPLKASRNFNAMVNQWSSKPLTAQFKNKSISVSDWEAPTLTTGQVLYAAFDVVALQEVVSGLRAYIKEHPAAMISDNSSWKRRKSAPKKGMKGKKKGKGKDRQAPVIQEEANEKPTRWVLCLCFG